MAILPDRTELTSPADGDLYVTTDVSDTTDAATGTDKKITWANIKATLATYFNTLYQTILVSGTNIKTINSQSVLGSGNLTVSADTTGLVPYVDADDDITFDGTAERAIRGGTSGAGVAGRNLAVIAGTGGTGNTAGGDLQLYGGSASGSGTGGNVILQPGDGGDVKIIDTAIAREVTLNTSTLTDNRTYTLPDGTGTLALTSDITGGVSDGDKGDITISASGATYTIDSGVVTLAKMANLAQDQFIGRVTASTGVPETATITAAARTVLDDTTVAAMVDTLGGTTSTGSGGLARATSPTFVTPILGTPTSGTLTNCTGLPVSGIVASTSTALGVGSIELGHASDTTIARVSAGIAAIEGNNIITANRTASDTVTGVVELATTAETNTGTSATLAVTPDGLAGSYAGTKSLSVQVVDGASDVTTGNGKAYITIPESLNGMNLVRAQATVVTAGTTGATTVMIHNLTDAQDMLSGAISIASGGTVGTVGTVNGSFDDVATNDILRIDVDSVSTTEPLGLMVVLEFRLP